MTLTLGEYEEFLRLTHAAKSAIIASVAQINNASAYLAHSLGPWILDSSASDHLFGNKDLFSSFTTISPCRKKDKRIGGMNSLCIFFIDTL